MSLSKSLQDIGRPVVFYPKLGRFFGSNNAAIFFAQLSYWLERTDCAEGVYKTAAEWTEETGLSVQEQRTARAQLKSKGYLSETHYRIEHKIYYSLDIAKIDADFSVYSQKDACKINIREVQNQHSGSAKSTLGECKINNRIKEQRVLQRVLQRVQQRLKTARLRHALTQRQTSRLNLTQGDGW